MWIAPFALLALKEASSRTSTMTAEPEATNRAASATLMRAAVSTVLPAAAEGVAAVGGTPAMFGIAGAGGATATGAGGASATTGDASLTATAGVSVAAGAAALLGSCVLQPAATSATATAQERSFCFIRFPPVYFCIMKQLTIDLHSRILHSIRSSALPVVRPGVGARCARPLSGVFPIQTAEGAGARNAPLQCVSPVRASLDQTSASIPVFARTLSSGYFAMASGSLEKVVPRNAARNPIGTESSPGFSSGNSGSR